MFDPYVGDRRARRQAAHQLDAAGAGSMGEVCEIVDGQVKVVLDDDLGGTPYGPVPVALALGRGTPQLGDAAFLHVDSQGQPAYAQVWATT